MAATLNDNLEGDIKSLESAFDELKITIYNSANAPLRDLVQSVTTGVLPAFTDLIKGVDGADVAFGAAIGDMVNVALTNLTSLLPQLLNVFSVLIPSITESINEQLPTLLSFIVGDLLPQVINTVADTLPSIIETIAELIPLLIDELINSIPLVLEAAIKLLM